MNPEVNLKCYDQFGELWYESQNHPIALLRAESNLFIPWLIEEFSSQEGGNNLKVLDLGCGGGLISNPVSCEGHQVVGIDLSENSLKIAKKHDSTHQVQYLKMDACELKFPNEMFDAVLAMDLLEHVEKPENVIREASRVLKKGGKFYFHTFNRTWFSYLLVIYGVEKFVQNTPSQLHVYRFFIRPKELRAFLLHEGLFLETMRGVSPNLEWKVLWSFLKKRTVPQDFRFQFGSSLSSGYVGIAYKPN
jgi:2-polyprenyl-6-hydroxyphenyl methylase/3-demethylubiquinone-9 3-methyltransferase